MDYKTALQDQAVRIKAMENNFPLFFCYHYGRPLTSFQLDWMESLQSKKNTMIIAFRASRKTTMVRGFIVWLICYAKEPSIIRQSYEDGLSGESVREIAKMLCKNSIVNDYGQLFPFETKKEDLAKKSLTNFETTNGVKLASRSLGQTLRGSNTYDMQAEMSNRPTCLILDDIDVVKSVMNVEIISQNEKKILGETIAALDPLRRKIIFLGNIINEDGVVPRFYQNYKDSEKRDCFFQPLYQDKQNVRPEVFTAEVVSDLQADGKTSFNQNYLLIPSSIGTGIFKRDYFDYYRLSDFEKAEGILKKDDLDVGIYIDPAFSTNSDSDDAVVLLGGKHRISNYYYLLDGYAETSAPSRTLNNFVSIYNKALIGGWNVKYVSVEAAPINKDQTNFIELLRTKMVECNINVPLRIYRPNSNKNVRIKDTLENIMSQKGIKFRIDFPDKMFTSTMEKQFLEFPNGDHDDIIDCIEQWVTQAKGVVKEKISKPRQFIDPATGETHVLNNNNPARWTKKFNSH